VHALLLDDVTVRFDAVADSATALAHVSWCVDRDQRWVVLGANGAGKTTLLRIASLYLHPSSGRVEVLGNVLGRCDVRTLRERIALSSPALTAKLSASMTTIEVVMTARYAALAPWWHVYTDADRERAQSLLERFGVGGFAEHRFDTLSAGERQRTMLARTLMRAPELLLLDEPTAGLDIGAREQVLGDLADLARDPAAPPIVVVTHHLEEVPAGFTHALVLKAGSVLSQGPILEVLTSKVLSDCFALSLRVEHHAGRFTARGTPS
jgi:iron complex transport system ATP-binding protein